MIYFMCVFEHFKPLFQFFLLRWESVLITKSGVLQTGDLAVKGARNKASTICYDNSYPMKRLFTALIFVQLNIVAFGSLLARKMLQDKCESFQGVTYHTVFAHKMLTLVIPMRSAQIFLLDFLAYSQIIPYLTLPYHNFYLHTVSFIASRVTT